MMKETCQKSTSVSFADQNYTKLRRDMGKSECADPPFLPLLTRLTSGQRASNYLPAMKKNTSRSSSTSSGDARKKENKRVAAAAAAAAAAAETTKRRATLNSRYDDEMLQRAIEESNKEIGTLGKRTRENIEEYVRN